MFKKTLLFSSISSVLLFAGNATEESPSAVNGERASAIDSSQQSPAEAGDLAMSIRAKKAEKTCPESQPEPNCCPKPQVQCAPAFFCPTSLDRLGPITMSARPSNSSGFYATADFLWWQAQEGATEWSFIDNNQELPDIGGPVENANMFNNDIVFSWDPGFRVGIGYNFDYDEWDAEVYYTWYFTSQSQSASSPFFQNGASDGYSLTAVIPLHTDINTSTQANINWGIHYSVIDGELGRNFFISRHLALRPHIGLKTGWINQKVNVQMNAHASSTNFSGPVKNQKENDFWGIGPSGGINTRWYLATFGCGSQHLSLFGDFSGALMWGRFHVKESEIEPGFALGATNHIKIGGINKHLIVPMMQTQIGLGWDAGFSNNCYHLSLNVGYELLYWFRQNQMLNILPNFFFGQIYYIYQRQSEDLRLHGLTADLRFDF